MLFFMHQSPDLVLCTIIKKKKWKNVKNMKMCKAENVTMDGKYRLRHLL